MHDSLGLIASVLTIITAIIGVFVWIYKKHKNTPIITAIITAIIEVFVWIYKKHKNKPTRILFVDDEINDFEIVKTLKKITTRLMY